MPNLYLIRRSDEAVWVYSECGQGRWQLSRMSATQASKVKHILLHGPKGWAVQDQSPGMLSGNSCIAVPVGSQSGTPAGDHPPMGPWQSPDGKCQYTLSDSYPDCPPLQLPLIVEEPFLKLTYSEKGAAGLLEVKITNKSITDDRLEHVLSRVQELLVNLARRPEVTVVLLTDLREAGVPGMRHVRRFIAFAKEFGDLMDLFIRGNAIILKPTGMVGNALVSIIKMMQRILQAAWPESIVPTIEEAKKFLERVAPAPLAQQEARRGAAEVVLGEVVKPTELKDASPLPVQVAPQLTPFASPTVEAPKVVQANGGMLQHRRTRSSGSLLDDNTTTPSSLKNSSSNNLRRYVSRKRNNAATHPELMKLEVPVWVAMGYRSGRVRPGFLDSKIQDVEAIIEDEQEPILCGCSCKSKDPALKAHVASQPGLQALFAWSGGT